MTVIILLPRSPRRNFRSGCTFVAFHRVKTPFHFLPLFFFSILPRKQINIPNWLRLYFVFPTNIVYLTLFERFFFCFLSRITSPPVGTGCRFDTLLRVYTKRNVVNYVAAKMYKIDYAFPSILIFIFS